MAKKGIKIRDISEVLARGSEQGGWLLRREREVCARPDGTLCLQEYLGPWEYLLLTGVSLVEAKCRTYRTRAAAVAAVQAHCGYLPEALRPKTGTVWAVVAQDGLPVWAVLAQEGVPGGAKVVSRHKTKTAAWSASLRLDRVAGKLGYSTVVEAPASCRVGYPLPIG